MREKKLGQGDEGRVWGKYIRKKWGRVAIEGSRGESLYCSIGDEEIAGTCNIGRAMTEKR